MTRAGARQLAQLARRTGQSRSNVVEHLLRAYGGQVVPSVLEWEAGRARPSPSVSLTALAKAILRAAADRTGVTRGAVVEALVQEYGPRVNRVAFAAGELLATLQPKEM